MRAWVRANRLEFLTVASLIALSNTLWRLRFQIPGAQSDWVPWYLIWGADPQVWVGENYVKRSTPFDVLRVAVLGLFVIAAMGRMRARAGTFAGLWDRLAVGAGSGALGAAAAAAVTALVMIFGLETVSAQEYVTASQYVNYLIMPRALLFGLFAGATTSVTRWVAESRLSSRQVPHARPASVFSIPRRNVTMPSSSDGPRRRFVLTEPPTTSAGPWAAPDITRTLCAAVRNDPGFRRRVLDLLTESTRRAVIASPGVDLRPVLRHAVDAEQRDYRRDLHRLAGLRPSPTSGVVGGLRSRVTPGSVLPVH